MAAVNFDASLKQVLRALDDLPVKIQANIARGGINAGAKTILEAARENVPVADGDLRKTIRISSTIDKRSGEVRVSVKAGGHSKSADAYYAHIVEFGSAPHIIPRGRFKGAKHPGTKPTGFMRRAYDGYAEAFVQKYAAYMRARIPKELAKRGA